jgi:hypothetical protein
LFALNRFGVVNDFDHPNLDVGGIFQEALDQTNGTSLTG